MNRPLLLSLAVSLTLFVSCHKKELSGSAASPAASSAATDKGSQGVKSVTVDSQTDMSNTGASYTVDSLAIKGNILSVFVNYSGGCQEHSFELLSDGLIAKSMPPQVTVCLRHNNNGDACRKLVMQELKFDVSAVKYKSGDGTTVIKLGDKRITCTGN